MITLQTGGPTNDLVLLNGNLVIISDVDQIAQSVRETLATFFGEWFLNNNIGVPWFQSILVSNPNLDHIQAFLLNAVQSVAGVSQLTSFTYTNFTHRSLSISMVIKTTNGQTINLEQTVGI